MVPVNSKAAFWLRAGVLGLASIATVLVLSADPAEARRRKAKKYSYNPPSASIVVDANSGRVLQASNPDALRHPASLTKIMTLYLLFERLEAGKLSLDSRLDVSEHASVQPPTKLGLKPGQTLKVEDAIKALVTKSANDAAVVVAEALGGSEPAFAQMMTRKARALGMRRTIYRNASGLPDSSQVTTARDQALLGRAVQERFPKYYHYFATTSFSYHGRAMRNHNKLLGRVDGVDGIKTGYTRASGFNLVTSVKRGNRYIVAVVLGGRSGGARDAHMRNLIAEHISDGATRRTVARITETPGAKFDLAADERPMPSPKPAALDRIQLASEDTDEDVAEGDAENATDAAEAAPEGKPATQVAAAPAPTARPVQAPPSSGVITSEPIAPVVGSTAPIKPVKVKTFVVRAKPARAGEAPIAVVARDEAAPTASIKAAAPAAKPVAVAAIDSSAKTEAAPEKPAKPAVRTGWIIQVGAFESESEAKERLEVARDRAKANLRDADPFTETVDKDGTKLYRARFAGLEKSEADQACRYLKRNHIPCITIRN